MTQRERQLLNWIEENPLISQQELADKAGITRSSVAVHISNLMKKGYITGKGYIVHTAPYVTVVGGVNMDIGGWPGEVPVMQDSNPGVVRMSLGGVGRNIAHNMALLGMDVRMVTVFGDDINAQKIAASCGELGIDISQSPIIPEGRTSTYLFITDEKGDMALAVSDMEIYKHLTPQMLAQRQTLLNASQAVVLDPNLPAESIQYLADHCTTPLFADPVSTAKAVKLKPVLGKLHTLKPNRIEAELLSGVKITDDASLRKAAETLLDTGLHRVFISLGSDGVFAADRSGQQVQLPPLPGAMVNTTGCGDAFMAAITWAYLQGTDLTDTAKAGLAASRHERGRPAAPGRLFQIKTNSNFDQYGGIQHDAEQIPGHRSRSAEGSGRGPPRGGSGIHHHLPRHALSPERGDRSERGEDHPRERRGARHHRRHRRPPEGRSVRGRDRLSGQDRRGRHQGQPP